MVDLEQPEGEGKSLSKVEEIKKKSRHLRGNLAEELAKQTTHFEDEIEKQLLKFHGIYQQDNRDIRKKEKEYSFMLRCRIPGGQMNADQYLAFDDIADRYANGTLRVTTRQVLQFHGVLKGDLKATMQEINRTLFTTYAACGDVVRTVMMAPDPQDKPAYKRIKKLTDSLSDHFLPRSRAYHEVWLDGEKVFDTAQEIEPIYKEVYLPRKFKIGVTWEGDNSIDVFSQDVGLVAILSERDLLLGFNVLVGGGFGMTHNKAETFPRLADIMAFATPNQVLKVVETILAVQRDYGDRTDRKHARLKYVLHSWGVERFRAEVEARLGFKLDDPWPMKPFSLPLYHGWQRQNQRTWSLGLSVENGRIADTEAIQMKTGLREIIRRFRPRVRLTPNQDVILTHIRSKDKDALHAMLAQYKIPLPETLSLAERYAMACPALPTCGLSLAEAERVLPRLIDQIEQELQTLGLAKDPFSIRMTGCPNGCARPYVADIAFVGRTLNKYTVFVGGRMDGTRLNQIYQDLVPFDRLIPTLRPLFLYYKDERLEQESFGDFCARKGIEDLRNYAQALQASESPPAS